MPPSREKLQETETIIRWDETDDPACLWTASSAVQREWKDYGFPVQGDRFNGWTAYVPKDRVTYKLFKSGQK